MFLWNICFKLVCVSSFCLRQLLLKFHLFLPAPSDRITAPLVTVCTHSLTHKLFHESLSFLWHFLSYSLHPALSVATADHPSLFFSVSSTSMSFRLFILTGLHLHFSSLSHFLPSSLSPCPLARPPTTVSKNSTLFHYYLTASLPQPPSSYTLALTLTHTSQTLFPFCPFHFPCPPLGSPLAPTQQ